MHNTHVKPLSLLSETDALEIRHAISDRRHELLVAWRRSPEDGVNGEFWALRIRKLNDAAIALGCGY